MSSEASAGSAGPIPAQVRVGVLLLLPEPVSGRVERVRASAGEESPPRVPPHVTLVPPTVVEASVLSSVVEHVAGVAAVTAPFEVRLAGTGSFQPVTDVVFLRVAGGAAECERLQDGLRQGPLAVDLRFPYHPHVTLAHDAPQEGLDRARAAMADTDERFVADRFVLFVDRGVEDWERVGEFALGGASAAAST